MFSNSSAAHVNSFDGAYLSLDITTARRTSLADSSPAKRGCHQFTKHVESHAEHFHIETFTDQNTPGQNSRLNTA